MLFENDVWSSIYEREWFYMKDGMPTGAIKFNVGDYAWAYIRGKFVPVKVIGLPYTPDQ